MNVTMNFAKCGYGVKERMWNMIKEITEIIMNHNRRKISNDCKNECNGTGSSYAVSGKSR